METNKPILDGVDPEIMDRLVSRRDAIRKGASVSSALAAGLRIGGVPIALAALTKDVFGQAPAGVLPVVQFAFILENLENEFYRAVLGTSGTAAQNTTFAPVRAALGTATNGAAITAALTQIQKHEQQHVDFLRTTITQLGGTPPTITGADFDFTGGNGTGTGPWAGAATNVDFLLLAAQAFEDTGVRAYKGQAGNLLVANNPTADLVLESALRIHSVEARHASKIRRIRRQRNTGDTTLRFSGYVLGGGVAAAGSTTNITGGVPTAVTTALGLVYGGAVPESNTQHVMYNDVTGQAVTVDAATVTNASTLGTGNTQANAATMAFDEPLTQAEVTAIIQDFIRTDAARGLP